MSTVGITIGKVYIRGRKKNLDTSLKKLMRDEELKWRRRAKEKDLKEGDANTRYYHLNESGRKKKNHISFLFNNGDEITRDKDLVEHVTQFYKDLFGHQR